MSDQDTPRNQTVENFLREVHSDFIGAFLKDAEAATRFTTSTSFVELWRGTIGKAKEFLKDTGPAILPAFPFQNHLARVEEAERTFDGLGPIENDVTSPDQGRALLRAIRAVFDSFGAVLDALGAADKKRAAEERAAHARKVRAERRAALAAMPQEEREKIAAAVENAKATPAPTTGRKRLYDLIHHTTNAPLEILGNALARGQTSKPAVVLRHPVDPAKNTIGFRERERIEVRADEFSRIRFTLTGGEVLGPVERQVWRGFMLQAENGKNPADLVGVSIRGYAVDRGISYKVAKEEIAKAVRNIYLLDMNLEEEDARRHGLPTSFRFIDRIWGEDDTLAEGFYLVGLSRTMVDHFAGGRGVQLPLLHASVSFIRNPQTDMFVYLFATQAANSTGNSNENIVSVAKLAEAANLLEDKAHLSRAKAIVERDLRAAETCGKGDTPALFKRHHYRKDGKRIPTTKAMALPPREWLKLTVEVEWNEGVIDYSKKRHAIQLRKERQALAEEIVKAKARKGKTK